MSETEDLDFAALGAPAPLAAALRDREYLTPTPVQARVLEAADADLLVSAQTGSGKTVAFGLVMARNLLIDGVTLTRGDKPRALVVAPTRELAAQVKRELTWLFAPTGARIAACTGGTDLRGDSRALRSGVDIVVGTPGRLVDLVQRKSLDLSGIEVLVLDEADEMLDLGFREALEELLGATPTERRTLLFSATLPPPIRALARRFQKDAIAIDPRAGAPAGAHEDIKHVANLVADGERLRALVNVLRLADDDRAIVFCRTRDNVADVHADLIGRGFLATAISGDREQAERTRALEALRHGKVRVLVATNVAARGLDLPDVGLVVHADLPENAEALTHRSGRTGRAGNKGVNLFIVERGARRRAERLFHEAHLKLQWTPAPDAEAVAAHDRSRLVAELAAAIANPREPDAVTLAEKLIADHDVVSLVTVLLERAMAGRPTGEKLAKVETRELTPPKHHAQPQGDMVLFSVNLGAKDKAEANWILPLICRRGDITRREVGAIRVARDRTFFEVASRVATEFAANAGESDPRAPHVKIERAEEPMPARSFAPSARPSHGKPSSGYGKPQARRPSDAYKPAHAHKTPEHKSEHKSEHKPAGEHRTSPDNRAAHAHKPPARSGAGSAPPHRAPSREGSGGKGHYRPTSGKGAPRR